jgi:acylglycerol lipase
MPCLRQTCRTIALNLCLLTLFSTSVLPAAGADLLKRTITKGESSSPLHVWKTVEEPQAIAVLLHGITASATTMESLAVEMTANKVLTYGMDLRGHGWWYHKPRKGIPGRKCDFRASVQDVERVLGELHQRYPELPIFLVGESVGAAVALRATVNKPDALDGVILCAPGYKTARANPTWILGDLLNACLLRKINIARYQRKYGTEDVVAMQEMMREPDLRTTFSIGELLGTLRFVGNNLRFARRINPEVSVLVLQGSNDLTLTPKSAEHLYSALPVKDKNFVMVPKCGHVLIATTRVKPIVKNTIMSFIARRSSAHALMAAKGTQPNPQM